MPETTPLIKAALNLRVGAGFDVYRHSLISFSCSSFGTRDFLVFAMMLSSIIVVVVVK